MSPTAGSDSGLEIRPVTDDELPAFVVAEHIAFSEELKPERIESIRAVVEIDRTLAAFDDHRIIGTAAAGSWELTVPGPAIVPAATVTAVAVLPTHRRRGVLTALMARQLDDVLERGEPVAVLTASESVIYGRFGYGLATWATAFTIDRLHARLARPLDVGGRVVMLDNDEAAKRIPDLYDDLRRRHLGALSRPPGWWAEYFRDPEDRRDGASSRFYALHEADTGEADGFVAYRVKKNWMDDGVAAGETQVYELYGSSPAVRAALWQFCLGVDLTATLSCSNAPVDEPLRWMLSDPRRFRVTGVADWLWARLVDIPAALGGRRYTSPARLVLDVADSFKPHNTGRYELVGGPDGAECGRTDSEPDLALSVADLGALYLGGVGCTALARAGRIEECRPGALATGDALFATPEAPWCATEF
jgi:predicted acetyltransferase